MPSLNVKKENGELLFSSEKITFGLVKSGFMQLNRMDGYYFPKGVNVDPNQKSSYNYVANRYAVHGFTVENASCPIVFIVGRGCLVGTSRNGSTVTFYYNSASTATKFFCFDLMRDTPGLGPYLKTWTDGGVCTFNSLMRPLNVFAAVTAPGPPQPFSDMTYTHAYNGGRYEVIAPGDGNQAPNKGCFFDVEIGGGELAAFLPWSRTARILDGDTSGSGGGTYYGEVEGAYGRQGGITFMFGATTEGTYSKGTAIVGNRYSNLPVDRFPNALVIQTSNLPFPYN